MSNQEAPAFWLSEDQTLLLKPYILEERSKRGDEILASILDEAVEVPGRPSGVETTLFGELLNFLANHGIRTPRGCRSQRGIVSLLDRHEAGRIEHQLRDFAANATDALLAEETSLTLVLYRGEPELVRQGMQYLLDALQLPRDRSSLLLIMR